MIVFRIVKNSDEKKQFIWNDKLVEISYHEEIENCNRLFVKPKRGVYKSFNGRNIKRPENTELEIVNSLNFSILCKHYACMNINVEITYENINDHPFSIWRNSKKHTYEEYETLYKRLNGPDLNNFSDEKLYSRISCLNDSSFLVFSERFFHAEYLLYQTTFCRNALMIFIKMRISRERILEMMEKYRNFPVVSIEMSVLLICPTSNEEYIEKLSDVDFSNCSINEIQYILMFTGSHEVLNLIERLFRLNVNMDCHIDHAMLGTDFLEKNFIEGLETWIEQGVENSIQLYIDIINKYSIYRQNRKVNICISICILYGENCYDIFKNEVNSCYIDIVLIIRTLRILNIEIDRMKIRELIDNLYLDYYMLLRSWNFPILDEKIFFHIFSFLNNSLKIKNI